MVLAWHLHGSFMQTNWHGKCILPTFWCDVLYAALSTGLPVNTQVDILGFDACLMGMYEINSILAPYSKYMLASELLEPGHGWDYKSLGGMVRDTTDMSAVVVGSTWIDGYFAGATAARTLGSGVTLAVMDQSLSSQMINNIVNLATTMTRRLDILPGKLSRKFGDDCDNCCPVSRPITFNAS